MEQYATITRIRNEEEKKENYHEEKVHGWYFPTDRCNLLVIILRPFMAMIGK